MKTKKNKKKSEKIWKRVLTMAFILFLLYLGVGLIITGVSWLKNVNENYQGDELGGAFSLGMMIFGIGAIILCYPLGLVVIGRKKLCFG